VLTVKESWRAEAKNPESQKFKKNSASPLKIKTLTLGGIFLFSD
jgi:hypothetical protein